MYELSYANIEFLKKEVSKSGITYSHLQDDLIDHLCCDVETEMKNKGLPFERAYDTVVDKIGFHGLQRIQEDTLYLIDKNYRIMKNFMKIFGVLSPVLIAFGALFKIEHWPGASILMVIGFFFLCFFFLPSAIYVSFKEISNRTRKFTYFSAFFGTFFLAVSFLFKVMHWPMAGIFFISGIFITCFIFLPSLVISKTKESGSEVPKYVYTMAFIGFIVYLLGFAFKMMHWPGATLLLLLGAVLLIFISLPIYTIKKYRHSIGLESSFIFIVFALVWFVIPITLMSLNVSVNLLKTNTETENVYIENIKYFEERNNVLMEKLPVNSQLSKIKTSTETLMDFVQSLKEEIAGGNQSYNAIVSGYTNNLNVVGSSARIMAGSKGKELIKMYAGYRIELMNNNDKALSNKIEKILPANLDNVLLNEEITDATSLNTLSFLQLNILRAENAYLLSLSELRKNTMLAGKNNI